MTDKRRKLVTIELGLLQDLVDIAVSGMDWGSGFLDFEQSLSLAQAAEVLGVDPVTVVQKKDRCAFFAVRDGHPVDHKFSGRQCTVCGCWSPL